LKGNEDQVDKLGFLHFRFPYMVELIGRLLPALRAARLPIVQGLYESLGDLGARPASP